MKKLLLSLLILAGFVATAPLAEAAHCRKKSHHRHGVVYYDQSRSEALARAYYYQHRFQRPYRSYGYAPRYYSAPVYRTSYRSYPAYYNTGYYNTGYYRSSSCHTYSRPRVAISFGF